LSAGHVVTWITGVERVARVQPTVRVHHSPRLIIQLCSRVRVHAWYGQLRARLANARNVLVAPLTMTVAGARPRNSGEDEAWEASVRARTGESTRVRREVALTVVDRGQQLTVHAGAVWIARLIVAGRANLAVLSAKVRLAVAQCRGVVATAALASVITRAQACRRVDRVAWVLCPGRRGAKIHVRGNSAQEREKERQREVTRKRWKRTIGPGAVDVGTTRSKQAARVAVCGEAWWQPSEGLGKLRLANAINNVHAQEANSEPGANVSQV
jgi:hypothetical protein